MAEKEYIEREEVREAFRMEFDNDYADGITDKLPTANVQEVRHGKWEKPTKPYPFYDWKCSECGCEEYRHIDHNGKYREMNYCPNCGAKMDEE